MNRLVAIVGPTATGKSQLALRLAQDCNGEIISADSRQVYRHMDIGMAKPSREELSLVPHHLIDIVNPDENFSLAQYQHLAYSAIADIQRRGKLPLLVGGSGLYIWAVLEGWRIPRVPPDPEFRHSLAEKAARVSNDEFFQELINVDPAAAQRIDRHNLRRVIRALEVHKATKYPTSPLQCKEAPHFNTLIIGLTGAREEIYWRIDSRVEQMIQQGLVEEVKQLMQMGYSLDLPAMSGIGYKQIGRFLKGEMNLAAAIQQTKFETHRFVRRQYNWFRLRDGRIKWFDIQDKLNLTITEILAKFSEKESITEKG